MTIPEYLQTIQKYGKIDKEFQMMNTYYGNLCFRNTDQLIGQAR